MKWLDNKDSVSAKELKENYDAAAYAYAAAYAAYAAAYAAYTAAYAAYTAAYAAYAAADAAAYAYAAAYAAADDAAYAAADDDYAHAEKWVNVYFERTKEDKQKYIDEINGSSESKEMIYTQEMYDNNIPPEIGMMVLSREEKLEVISVCHIAEAKVLTLLNNKTSGVNALYFMTGQEVNILPIDTRTAEEKAIDDLSEYAFSNPDSTRSLPHNVFSAIKAGKILGISFTGDK